MKQIELEKVTVGFGRGKRRRQVLKSLSLRVGRGECLAIFGSKGAGKSTLLAIIAGLLELDDGEAVVGTYNLTVCSTEEKARMRREEIGVYSEEAPLFAELTVQENIAFFLATWQQKKRNPAWLKEVAGHFGVDPLLALPTKELRHYDCQAVRIARAAAGEPAVFLIDGPIDPLLFQKLRQWARKRQQTILFATSSYEEALWAPHIVELDNGVIREWGGNKC
ncbi:ABC transporter ATP-binding protein [Shouchella clausii]|nr:ABC transporter ATP-binding protein [Shouchella clausii]